MNLVTSNPTPAIDFGAVNAASSVTGDLMHLAGVYFGGAGAQLRIADVPSSQPLSSGDVYAAVPPPQSNLATMNDQLVKAMCSSIPSESNTKPTVSRAPVNTVFLQDVEMQTAKYNPNTKYEVFDLDLQDLILALFYQGLPPLRKRHVHPSFVKQGSIEDKEIQTGGQVKFSNWPKTIADFSLLTLCLAMTFTDQGKYINPAHISPARVTVSATRTGSGVMRLNAAGVPVICLAAGAAFETFLVHPKSTAGADPWIHKYISVILHSQDWKRWEAFFCQSFGHPRLYTNITSKAVHFSSVLVRANAAPSVTPLYSSAPSGLLSPSKSGVQHQSSSGSAYSLLPSDTIPIYNAMNTDFDFSRDISNYASLPL
ncbi:hypothetical protein K438DRAFT_1995903 [Mycena galopus ATCC 62051]|nr:hypothetical protein K438DRAFT_1995903 [Mycena galopus ATCC 62051]